MGFKKKNPAINKADKATEEKKIHYARVFTNCFASAAMAINNLHGNGQILDCPTVMEELIKSSKKINSGDICEIEQILMTQAKALDYVFYDALNKLVDLNMIDHVEVFTNIAFRSQAQCRKTLAVLAELKHPRRATFIKQQNNAITQQINNNPKSDLKKNKKVANELLSEIEHASLDFRRAPKTIRINPAMETMEQINRAQDD